VKPLGESLQEQVHSQLNCVRIIIVTNRIRFNWLKSAGMCEFILFRRLRTEGQATANGERVSLSLNDEGSEFQCRHLRVFASGSETIIFRSNSLV
jgi:hypothetical protein